MMMEQQFYNDTFQTTKESTEKQSSTIPNWLKEFSDGAKKQPPKLHLDGEPMEANKKVINSIEKCKSLIAELNSLVSFLDKFSFLNFERDCILCKNYVFSLTAIFMSLISTLYNAIDCCEKFCIADTYTLLRKYRDDLFFCIYISLYDRYSKGATSPNLNKMEKNIALWCENKLSNLNISEVLSAVGRSDILRDAVEKYHLKKSFEEIGERLNNFVHGNGYSFYNQRAWPMKDEQIEAQLNEVVETAFYITTAFLFLLTLCSPRFIMATDYVDYLEFGQTPPKGAQRWVAPFVEEYLKEHAEMIDKNCYQYLKENVCMDL